MHVAEVASGRVPGKAGTNSLLRGDAHRLSLVVNYMSKHQKVGDIDLFFGCRYINHDYLYRKELDDFKAGILTVHCILERREEREDVCTDAHADGRMYSMENDW